MNTYISLTTISSRLDILKDCLDSLIAQKEAVTKILLTIPKKSMRGKKIKDIPDYLYSYPYSEYVKIIRPYRDYGPIMKYIGAARYVNDNDLVMVCDDDQRYDKYLLKRLVDKYNELSHLDNKVVTSSGYTILTTDVAWGMGGVLLSGKVLKLIKTRVINASRYVRSSCENVDDNWVSVILKYNNIPIINMHLNEERFVNGIARNPPDGLSNTTNRYKHILTCTYAIDHSNIYPIVAAIIFVMFLVIIWGYYRFKYSYINN